MKKIHALAVLALLLVPTLAAADTVSEVKKTIEDNLAYTRDNKVAPPDTLSQHGSAEFWSSGGLLQWARPSPEERAFESFNLHAKHIEVIPLVEGQVALAMYYSEGSMQPQGYPPVSHYLVRVSQVLVKEDGKWKLRSSHWSPITAGGGTTQSAE